MINLVPHDDMETSQDHVPFKVLVSDKFDNIRFPQYRIACKLRYLQKETKFYLIDLFNTIESFREFGLNAEFDLNALVPTSQIHLIIDSIYIQLLQRIPSSQKLDVDYSVDLIYNWLLDTFDLNQSGFISSFAFKIALTVLCSSTYTNKLRYLFTLLSDNEENLIDSQFDLFLQHLLAIPKYFEDISVFTYEEDLHLSLFKFTSPINLQSFIETLTYFGSELDFKTWLIVYNRLADAETVVHSITCNPCGKSSFTGFRYKCKKCFNYNLCQDCFWTGKRSDHHEPNKHPCKEYLFDKSKNQLKSLRSSFRKSFRFFPTKQLPDEGLPKPNQSSNLTKRLNLSNLISSPKLRKSETCSTIYEYKFHDPPLESSYLSVFNQNTDEEMNLISNYLYLLKSKDNSSNKNSTGDIITEDFEQIIESLENKNRKLMKSIAELKELNTNGESHENKSNISLNYDNVFFDELISLRRKKDDLENHLGSLQDKKKILMDQLDNLMKEFNCHDDYTNTDFGIFALTGDKY